MNRRGFSLIELMVVVAVIGVLATIAVPNYQKYQARARQTGAKSDLSALFTAEKSIFGEYGFYTGVLPLTGFVPEGVDLDPNLHYPPLAGSKRTYNTYAGYRSGTEDPAFINMYSLPLYPSSAGYRANPAICPLVQPYSESTEELDNNVPGGPYRIMAATTFRGVSIGCPLAPTTDPLQADAWTIDQDRVLQNVHSGL